MDKDYYKIKKMNRTSYNTSWNIYPKLLKKIKLLKGEKILDAGCGNGRLADHLKGYNLYGFDNDSISIKNSRKKGYKKVIKSEIYDTPFKDKEFDKTVCIQVFPYLSNPEKAFKELMRITKNELIISTTNFNWFKIKMMFSKKFKNMYNKELRHLSNETNSHFLKKLSTKNRLNVRIFHLSNKFGFFRNSLGESLASEVVGVFKRK